jgi:aryl-alcohol dehydrogenase-like predicted oxidoreductase
MEYRSIGKSGLRVSPLCLGTAFRGWWQGLNEEVASVRTIERAIELGINFIDGANFYFQGRCEALLGKTLKGMGSKRDDLVITSKVWSQIGEGPNDKGLSRYHIMRECERSLKRLQTDHIDIYLLHSFDPHTPLQETLRAMDDLVRQGKVRYVGACNFTAAQLVESLWIADQAGYDPFIILQNQYNLMHRWEIEPELFPRCTQHGLGMMSFSPLAVGLLTGLFRRGKQPPAGSHWASNSERHDEILTQRNDQIIQALTDIASAHGKTPAQTAINWLLDHPELSAPIIGPDHPEHVDEAMGALGWNLTTEQRTQLDEVSQFAPHLRYT